MRIYCLVPDAFGGHGGISVYNKDLLTAFSEISNVSDVYVVPRVIRHDPGLIPDKIHFRRRGAYGKLAFMATILADLPRIARSDLIYCGHLNFAPVAKKLGGLFKIPVLGALYGIDAWTPSSSLNRRKASIELDHYYAISAYTRDRFREWSGVSEKKIVLHPNAIHLDSYPNIDTSSSIQNRLGLVGRRVILTFGRLVSKERAKGFDEVLDVLPDLLREFPDLIYVIAGDGPDRKRLETRALTEGLEDNVVFTGYVEEDDKTSLYRSANLYVMPSSGEGFGFVFLEALANGLPVVASSVDGSRDAVRDGLLGPMVNPDDPNALKSAISQGLQKSHNIPDGLSYFDFPNFVKRTSVMIQEMVIR